MARAARLNLLHTEYASAGNMFELGAKVQVLKKGLFSQLGLINCMNYIDNTIQLMR
jgi:hypothetical protein